MLQFTDAKGYKAVCLRKDGKRTRHYTHALVLSAFVGARKPGMQTAHINGKSGDNRLENLKYATAIQNSRDAVRHHRIASGEDHAGTSLTRKDVLRLLDLRHRKGRTYQQIADVFGISKSSVYLISTRQRWVNL